MDGNARSERWARTAALMLVGVFAFLLAGPLIDHHFHERFPGHGHFISDVLGVSASDHAHGHDDPSHSHGPRPESPEGVAIVPVDQDGIAGALALVILAASFLLLGAAFGRLRLTAAPTGPPRSVALVAPPSPPPRW